MPCRLHWICPKTLCGNFNPSGRICHGQRLRAWRSKHIKRTPSQHPASQTPGFRGTYAGGCLLKGTRRAYWRTEWLPADSDSSFCCHLDLTLLSRRRMRYILRAVNLIRKAVCRLFHRQILWPINGQYVCARCGRVWPAFQPRHDERGALVFLESAKAQVVPQGVRGRTNRSNCRSV